MGCIVGEVLSELGRILVKKNELFTLQSYVLTRKIILNLSSEKFPFILLLRCLELIIIY